MHDCSCLFKLDKPNWQSSELFAYYDLIKITESFYVLCTENLLVVITSYRTGVPATSKRWHPY